MISAAAGAVAGDPKDRGLIVWLMIALLNEAWHYYHFRLWWVGVPAGLCSLFRVDRHIMNNRERWWGNHTPPAWHPRKRPPA